MSSKMDTPEKYYTDNQKKIARYAKALSHPARVYIMDYLVTNLDKCCYSGDMVENLPIARSTLSEHLKELKRAGLIQGEINPPYIKYCINRGNWEEAKLMMETFFKRVNISDETKMGSCSSVK
jgi:ArsR family transcriptional regulator, arsenate/arsenite/antimonite-responsive transcriptional repressor